MSNRRLIFILCAATVLLFALCMPAQVLYAHGDEARLELGALRVNPGASMDLRGVGFEPEEAIALLLEGTPAEIPLGEVTADEEGSFTYIFVVPPDLAPGDYTVHTEAEDGHSVRSPAFTVWGTVVAAGEEGGQREREEPLLAPLPAPTAAVVPQDTGAAPLPMHWRRRAHCPAAAHCACPAADHVDRGAQ